MARASDVVVMSACAATGRGFAEIRRWLHDSRAMRAPKRSSSTVAVNARHRRALTGGDRKSDRRNLEPAAAEAVCKRFESVLSSQIVVPTNPTNGARE